MLVPSLWEEEPGKQSPIITSILWILSCPCYPDVVVWMWNTSHKLTCSNTWFPVGALWESCGTFKRWSLLGRSQSQGWVLRATAPPTWLSLLNGGCGVTFQPLAPSCSYDELCLSRSAGELYPSPWCCFCRGVGKLAGTLDFYLAGKWDQSWLILGIKKKNFSDLPPPSFHDDIK